MPAFKRTRISDVSFTMDSDLNVTSANRNFASLFDITDVKISLKPFLDETDIKNLKDFLDNLPEGTTKPFFVKMKSSAATVDFTLETTRNPDNLFFVKLFISSFEKETYISTMRHNLELKSVLKNFDCYYFTYNGTWFKLKSSKEQTSVFVGKISEFKNYIISNFNFDLSTKLAQEQFETMLSDVQKFKTKKSYKFYMTNKKLLIIRPETSPFEDGQLLIGTIFAEDKAQITENFYSRNNDGLTDMFNKKSITEQAVHKIDVLKEPCSLIILDIDKFKDYNDTFGHAYGDKVIVAVANVIKDAMKDIGVAGRIGGDEFLALINTTDEDEIRNVTRNIRMGITWAVNSPDLSTVVTCSMGIARFPLNAKSYDDIFKLADKCLYIAKNKGRNCYVIYKPELHDKIIIKNEKQQAVRASGKIYNDDADTQIHIMEMLNTKEGRDLNNIIAPLREYMGVTQITLYKADKDGNLLPAYESGGKSDFRQPYFKKDYFRHFNSYNFLHLDNTTNLDTIDKEFQAMYSTNQVASVIEYARKDENGETKALLCYDIYKPARTFAKDKLVFAILMAKILTKII